MASREYCVMGWSRRSAGVWRGSTQHTSPLEPLKRQRESQVRIPITLLEGGHPGGERGGGEGDEGREGERERERERGEREGDEGRGRERVTVSKRVR